MNPWKSTFIRLNWTRAGSPKAPDGSLISTQWGTWAPIRAGQEAELTITWEPEVLVARCSLKVNLLTGEDRLFHTSFVVEPRQGEPSDTYAKVRREAKKWAEWVLKTNKIIA